MVIRPVGLILVPYFDTHKPFTLLSYKIILNRFNLKYKYEYLYFKLKRFKVLSTDLVYVFDVRLNKNEVCNFISCILCVELEAPPVIEHYNIRVGSRY